MSLKAWKEKYYPVDAKDAEDALAHSIKKWDGLLDLEQFGVTAISGVLEAEGEDDFGINDVSCALCQKHPGCEGCPLYVSRDYTPCDVAETEDEDEEAPPYHAFTRFGDPKPMIKALNALIP